MQTAIKQNTRTRQPKSNQSAIRETMARVVERR